MSMKHWLGLAAGLALASAFVTPSLAEDKRIAVVVKIGGIPYFNAMEMGIENADEDEGVDAWMVGPTTADPAQQVRIIEDLIAQKVDVIGVIPNDAQVLDPVLARAREAGIKVITHESPDQKSKDWDLELITNEAYAKAGMDSLAEGMGGKGQYVVYVGSLTVPLHNLWADIAIAYQKEKYPDMELLGDRYGVTESLDDTYRTTLDLLRANPDLKGVLTYGTQGPIGAGRAVVEQDKVGDVTVVGAFSPGQGEKLVKQGAIKEGFIWSPILAGEAIVRLGKLLADGVEIEDGMEIEGLGPVTVDSEAGIVMADKPQAINADTIDELVALGL